jgi:hypothetical protein
MNKIVCETCGKLFSKKYAVAFPVIPVDVARRYGIKDAKVATVCLECSHQLPRWYEKTVSLITYNTAQQHFQDRTAEELVAEYEYAFERFKKFKSRTGV